MLIRRLCAVAVLASLAACASSPPVSIPPPTLSFNDGHPITFAASGPVIVDQSVHSDSDPHVERLMPVNLDASVQTWAKERLHGSGVGGNTLKVVIKDSSVIEKVESKETGVQGLVTDQVDAGYTASVDVEIQVVDASGAVQAHAEAILSHTRQILQRASLDERNAVWADLVTGLTRELDQRLSGEITRTMGPLLVNP